MFRLLREKNKNMQKAQATIEFAFSFIILLLLLYGLMMAFRWAGASLAERRIDHELTLNSEIDEGWDYEGESPMNQLRTDFAEPEPMQLIFNQW